jgi:hypothetical protein
MKTRSFGSYACLILWQALMLGALAASSQSAKGLFISRSLNFESWVTAYRLCSYTLPTLVCLDAMMLGS